ncbi:ABC transporter family substrate-binding protein [Bifidobacterium avesanii]|uniref:ABC transporter family substrate-binding protein n=1 Tax=Bifidobacterium avesanii TaxID=1798157 RepID=A0A7K3TIG7_9BIFI|nr:ABC transporter family substrate-binding protein [Bifidobacterium avesanii]KAB8289898.1 peptide ABC transporter substrate-binding protein [Bifidobacterium avesanii]NEG78861.1 ABC transporter family substrate-binding protein [Bifidobacterium avesanii]
MKFASMRKATALLASVAALVSLAACGGNGNTNAAVKNDTTTAEPSEGTPINQDSYPMPDPTSAYNNPKDRSALKQGGTLTLAITEIGPDFNALSVNGNTSYMSGIWKFYMPSIWDYSVDGSKAEPNTNYVTKVEETSTDPETIKFTINDKASWNDGTPITWKDFYATWKVSNGESDKFTPAITTGYDSIDSVKAGANDKEVVVTFKNKFYPYQSVFQQLYPSMAYDESNLDKTADTYTNGWSKNPHADEWGAGPYTIQSFDDTQITFVPNPKWWGDKPLLDSVQYKQMEPSASINAFKNGEIDGSGVGTADRLATAKTVEGAYLRRSYDTGVSTLTINAKSANTSDVNLRKAFVQAVDRSQLAAIDYNGMDWTEKVPGSVILPQFQAGYEDNMPADSAFSTDNAKKTLEAAGYTMGSDGYYTKDGKTAGFTYTTFSDAAQTKAKAQAIQKMAKDAGIKIDIDIKASSEFSKTVGSGNWDMIGLGWSASDPFVYSSSSYQLYGSDSESNYGFVGSSEVDDILKKVVQTEDSTEAIKMFNEAEKKYMENYAQIPFENGYMMFACKKGLANYGPAGYASNLTMGIPNHTENIGWEK